MYTNKRWPRLSVDMKTRLRNLLIVCAVVVGSLHFLVVFLRSVSDTAESAEPTSPTSSTPTRQRQPADDDGPSLVNVEEPAARSVLEPALEIDHPNHDCTKESPCRYRQRYGTNAVWYSTSRGYFSKGCRWRQVHGTGARENVYEFFNEDDDTWETALPPGCVLQTEEPPEHYVFSRVLPSGKQIDTAATTVEPRGTHTIMNNLWYNSGRWYALVEGDEHESDIKMSRNQKMHCLHVRDADAWTRSINFRLVRKNTVLFDFIYFIHPTAIGHWLEMLHPLFSVLKESGQSSQFAPPDVNIVLLHLQRWHIMEWVRAVIAATMHVEPAGSLPPVLLQRETDQNLMQPTMPLEGIPDGQWVVFERVLIIRDVFTGGRRSFKNTKDAREYRERIYALHHLSLPPGPPDHLLPKVITFQRKRKNRRIVNEGELLKLLESYAPVHVVEFNESHSFQEQIEAMRSTGLYVSAHTSNLANTVFLPPGASVLELIHRFWFWKDLDKSFYVQTEMLGDIHHFAWRSFYLNQTVYLDDRDRVRFGNWTSQQCHTEECVEAHTNVDVIVDIAQLKTMLDARLPLVFSGASVDATYSVWPAVDPHGPQPWNVPPGREHANNATGKGPRPPVNRPGRQGQAGRVLNRPQQQL